MKYTIGPNVARLALLSVVLFLAAGVVYGQKTIPVKWGQSEAEVRHAFGEPDENAVNAIGYHDVDYFGFRTRFIVYLDTERRTVDAAAYIIGESDEESWRELISAMTDRFGRPESNVAISHPSGPEISEEEARSRDNYIRRLRWRHARSVTIAELYVSPGAPYIAVTIEQGE